MTHHVTNAHRIRLPLPAADATQLFTPAGEELWVDGWTPRYLHPADGRTTPGMIFTTGSGSSYTIWSLVDFEPGYARYARVTPGSRSGFVEVRIEPDGDDAAWVEVRYTLTALADAAAADLDAYRGDALVAMIEGWKATIEGRLPALRAAIAA